MTFRGLLVLAAAATAVAAPPNAFALRSKQIPHPSLAFRGGGIGRGGSKSPPHPPAPAPRRTGLSGKIDNYIDKIFDDADTNQDGSISTSETYELVLKMYVKINRKAPIPPPSREKVQELFRGADADRSGRLSRDEFRSLALVLASRASTRLVAHKIVTIVCAPLLAVEVVRISLGKEWVRKLADRVLPERVTGVKVAGMVRKAEFWRTALTVGFVVTLGNLMLAAMDLVLDLTQRKDDDEEQEAVAKKKPSRFGKGG